MGKTRCINKVLAMSNEVVLPVSGARYYFKAMYI